MKNLKKLGMAAILGIIVYIILLLSNCIGVKLASIAITPETATIGIGKTVNFTATATYTDGTTANSTSQVTWTSDNPGIAKVSSTTGIATGATSGNTTISASFNGMASRPASLTVQAELTGISISPKTPSTLTGVPVNFTAAGAYSDGSIVDFTSRMTWVSSDTTVATLDVGGIATSLAPGNTTVSASFNGIAFDNTTLTVTAPVLTEPVLTAIAITPAPASVTKGLDIKFTATGTYSDGKTANVTKQVTWSSGNAGIARINRTTGVATGVAKGNTAISASIGGIISPSASLAVSDALLTSISIAPATISSPQGVPVAFTATGTYSNNITGDISGSAKWVSSNTTVATIDSAGLATGVNTGSSNITASIGSINSNTAILTVTQLAPSAPAGVMAVSSQGQATISWLPVKGAVSYNLYWATTSGITGTTNKISGVTPPYIHSGLTDGKIYYYRVSAENAAGETLSAETSALLEARILGNFITTGSLSLARQSHTATLLPNGKVLIAGGLSGAILTASAEIYDPAAGKFSATGSMAEARKTHTATLLPNGKVLIVGGVKEETPLASAEIFDPATNNFSATGRMSNARQAHTATMLPNGKDLMTVG